MESNAQEFISKKFAKIGNVTTGNVTRDIQDHVGFLGWIVIVGFVQVAGTATDSREVEEQNKEIEEQNKNIESLREITYRLSKQVADQTEDIKGRKLLETESRDLQRLQKQLLRFNSIM